MKKRIFIVMILGLFIFASAYADVFMTKKAGDYTVYARFEKTPTVGAPYW